MKNYFLFEDIILEGRLEDVKKKHPDVNPNLIDLISQKDPSGENKYLDWMIGMLLAEFSDPRFKGAKAIYDKDAEYGPVLLRFIDGMVIDVTGFNNNLNKITPELIDEIPDSGGIGQAFSNTTNKTKIKKAPRDIKSYTELFDLHTVVRYVKEKLSKSEVKKLQVEVLLNNSELLILIPKSHQTSCYYGAGTRWCTTQKDPSYYNRYMSRGLLIYVISKKESPDNRWYKTAFFIENGRVSAFDAPDKPSTVAEAKTGLGKYWETVRDTIVDYLYEKDIRGINDFYFGDELIAWLESRNLDPLKVLTPEEFKTQIGTEPLINYLKKREINYYEFLDFNTIFEYEMTKHTDATRNDISAMLRKIWYGYIENNVNPLEKIVKKNAQGNLRILSLSIDKENGISTDSFLEQAMSFKDPKGHSDSIFAYLDGEIHEFIVFFKNSADLVFGFADTIGANLFKDLNTNLLRYLLAKKFNDFKTKKDVSDAINLITEKGRVNESGGYANSLKTFGITNEQVLDYLSDKEDKKDLFRAFVAKGLLKHLTFEDYANMAGFNETTFWDFYFLSSVSRNRSLDVDSLNSFFNERKITKTQFNKVFKNFSDFLKSLEKKLVDFKNLSPDDIEAFEYEFFAETNLDRFYEGNYYEKYFDFKESNILSSLKAKDIFLAYSDAPIEKEEDLEVEIYKLIKEMTGSLYSGGRLDIVDKKAFVSYDIGAVEDLSKFFTNSNRITKILENQMPRSLQPPWYQGTGLRFSDINLILEDNKIKNLLIDHLRSNFLNQMISVTIDVIDEFPDRLVSTVDNRIGSFNIRLSNSVLEFFKEDPTLMALMIGHSSDLVKLADATVAAYEKSLNALYIRDLKDLIFTAAEDVFGGRHKITKADHKFGGQIKILQYEYPHLLDDLMVYFSNIPFDSEIPDNVTELLTYLMSAYLGRFNDAYSEVSTGGGGLIDISETIEDFEFDLDYESPVLRHNFAEILYEYLLDLEY